MPLRGPGAWSRETRLLWLTIAVSLGVLFVLAQFRFPNEERLAPAPQPLERLAARATYEELAADVARLEHRVAPALLVLRVHSTRAPASRSLRQLLDRGRPQGLRYGDGTEGLRYGGGTGGPLYDRNDGSEAVPRFVPALRSRSDVAVALLGSDAAVSFRSKTLGGDVCGCYRAQVGAATGRPAITSAL